MTSIQWTDATWNPIVGCSRVSAGCVNCYAERLVHRGLAPQHRGLTVMRGGRPGWTGEVRLVADRLAEPLSWRKPRRVFVNSLSDLFHERLDFEVVAAIFGVMAASPGHVFQVLTKRPARMREFFSWYEGESGAGASPYAAVCTARQYLADAGMKHVRDALAGAAEEWPLPHVWLGVSVEDQAAADGRIPHLLACPAAVRWVSYEPALGPVDFNDMSRTIGAPKGDFTEDDEALGTPLGGVGHIDWIVVGGESGPGARPFDIAWARSTIAQCREAGTRVFVKQLGARPVTQHPMDPASLLSVKLTDRKGGDMIEWPDDLRVREMPSARGAR